MLLRFASRKSVTEHLLFDVSQTQGLSRDPVVSHHILMIVRLCLLPIIRLTAVALGVALARHPTIADHLRRMTRDHLRVAPAADLINR